MFLLLLFIFLSNDVKVFAKGNPPAISSENAILMDGASGKILYSKNPPLIDGSKAGIKEKEEVTVKDLLYGLLFVSGMTVPMHWQSIWLVLLKISRK